MTDSYTNHRPRRPIRSFVIRSARLTAAQQHAFDANWLRWGLQRDSGLLDRVRCFGRPGPLVLEIGFGMGQSLLQMAAAAPATNYLGIDIYRPGAARLMQAMREQQVGNIRIYCDDAVAVMQSCLADDSLDGVQIFFPDPWPKKRHHKRRLIQAPFVELLVSRLRPGGFLHLATDWEHYAGQMLNILEAEAGLGNSAGRGNYSPRPEQRPPTKFELRGQRLGHEVYDLLFRKRGVSG